MAVNRSLDIRWIRRYKVFIIGGFLVLLIQVFLALKFIHIDSYNESSGQEHLSGKGKLNLEVLDDRSGQESSRRFRDNYLGGDDEDDDANSNAAYGRIKVPPDKNFKSKLQLVPRRTSNNGVHSNKTGWISLRGEELDFIPMCDTVNKEAASAVSRARSQHCKQLIVNTTCLIAAGELYPHSLPHNCPAPGLVRGKLLGCYQDSKTRLLPNLYSNLKGNNSPALCVSTCLQSGFPYGGVQYRSECFCGEDEPPLSARLRDSSCNMKCPGDAKEACGGYYTMNVYLTGVARWTPQAPREAAPLAKKDSPVRIVFLLTLNGRAIRQVRRLIKALFHRDHYFYIHVDSRQDYLWRELSEMAVRLSNVRLTMRRHSTIWGGSSLLTMLLEALHELARSAWRWDFVINLSETDFPVKKNEELVQFLTANRGFNFVKSHGHEASRFIQKQGLDKTFVECEAHMWRAGERVLPEGIVIDGGSDWLALSRPFVDYLTNPDQLVTGLTQLFKYTLLPAESFFHTVLRNSGFCETYIDNNLHVTNWRRRLGCKCQYRHVVDWCGCSPNCFKSTDWHRLQGTESRPLFFARKFEPVINQAVINQLEEWLYGPYPADLSGLNSYWQSSYDIQDTSPADDALVTIGSSLTRAAAKNLSTYWSNHNLTSCQSIGAPTLQSISVYYHQDTYQGSLLLFEISDDSESRKFEAWVKPVETSSVLKNIGPSQRIKWFQVSSEYDQKEEMYRNVFRTLGPYSEPVAVVGLNSAAEVTLTVVWIDPLGTVAAASDLPIEDLMTASFSKPALKTPLFPGVWEAYLIANNTPIMKTIFLVSPLQQLSNSPLTNHRQTEFVHGGPGERYPKLSSDWAGMLGKKHEPKRGSQRRVLANSRRVGKDLYQWIDQLVSRFYVMLDMCQVPKCTDSTCPSPLSVDCLQDCSSSTWSSFSPDPKSQIVSIDKATGQLNRW